MSTNSILLPVILVVLTLVIIVAVVIIVSLSRKKHDHINSGVAPAQQTPVQPTIEQQSDRIFCPQCGNILQPDGIYCNNCGQKVR